MNTTRPYFIVETEQGYIDCCFNNQTYEANPDILQDEALLFPYNMDYGEYTKTISAIQNSGYKKINFILYWE